MEDIEETARPEPQKVNHIEHLRNALRHAETRIVMRLTMLGHFMYYLLVSWEAHGNYRYAAGMLGVLLLVEAFTGNKEGAP